MALQQGSWRVLCLERRVSWRLATLLAALLKLLMRTFQKVLLDAVALDRELCGWAFLMFFRFLDSLKGLYLKLTTKRAIVEASRLEARRWHC